VERGRVAESGESELARGLDSKARGNLMKKHKDKLISLSHSLDTLIVLIQA